MRKIQLIIIFLVIALGKMQAQYTIPGAMQQPAWVFPLWFENAMGQKDTVYIGYDANAANISVGTSDTVYGEKWIVVDTSKFNMFWGDCCDGVLDTVYKVLVLNNGNLGGAIYALQGWLPIKMSWDVNLFRSDSLPFLDQSPAPRADMLVWFQGDASDITGPCMSPGDPLLATDTAAFGGGFAICIRKDSVIFTQLSYLAIEIRPWTGMYLSVKENQKPAFQVQVFPNPFSSSAMLNITDSEQNTSNCEIKIYDMLGKFILKDKITNRQLEIKRDNLSNGLFFYEISNPKKQTVRGKLIIQ